jgi:hypothetical protein
VYAYVFPYVLLQDTPEKTSCNGLSSFTAKNAAFYGFVVDIEEREGLLPSCGQCHRRRLYSTYAKNTVVNDETACLTCYDLILPGLEAISTWAGLLGYFNSVMTGAIAEGMTDKKKLVSKFRLAGISPTLSTTLAEYVQCTNFSLGLHGQWQRMFSTRSSLDEASGRRTPT